MELIPSLFAQSEEFEWTVVANTRVEPQIYACFRPYEIPLPLQVPFRTPRRLPTGARSYRMSMTLQSPLIDFRSIVTKRTKTNKNKMNHKNIRNYFTKPNKYLKIVPDDNKPWYGGENNCNGLIEEVKKNIIERVDEVKEQIRTQTFRGVLKSIDKNEGGKRKSKKSKKSKKVKGKKSKKVKMTKKRKAKKTTRKRKLRK